MQFVATDFDLRLQKIEVVVLLYCCGRATRGEKVYRDAGWGMDKADTNNLKGIHKTGQHKTGTRMPLYR